MYHRYKLSLPPDKNSLGDCLIFPQSQCTIFSESKTELEVEIFTKFLAVQRLSCVTTLYRGSIHVFPTNKMHIQERNSIVLRSHGQVWECQMSFMEKIFKSSKESAWLCRWAKLLAAEVISEERNSGRMRLPRAHQLHLANNTRVHFTWICASWCTKYVKLRKYSFPISLGQHN